MLKYRLLFIGRKAKDPLLEAAQGYLTRLNRYTPVDMVRLKEGHLTAEAAALRQHIGPNDYVVVLDERGLQLDTQQLAARLSQWQRSAMKNVTWIVGGAHGLDPSVKALAQELWALSRLTLPHRLAQVVLVEQLYRAHTILRGQPYHHT